MTEAELQAQILHLCKAMNLLAYHTHDSRRSQPGFPDLVIVGFTGILFRELKSETGKTSADQDYWLAALQEACADAKVWRPSDWPVRIHEELSELGSLRVVREGPSRAELRKILTARSRK